MGLLHSCATLTQLLVSYCIVLDGFGGVDGLMPAAVAQLQHFSCRIDRQLEDSELAQALQNRLIPHLTSLTCLDLDFRQIIMNSFRLAAVPTCFSQHISSIVGLQRLALAGSWSISASTLPGIKRLTALESLSLSACDLEPSCLLHMSTSLTNLYIGDVTLQRSQAQQDGALGASQLLQLLARLTALRCLALENTGGKWPQQLSAHSALTASSNLQDLIIQRCDIQSEAWVHVFPPGRTLPHLHTLSAALWSRGRGPAYFGSAGISGLVRCCPGLRRLACALGADASLAPLESLTALSQLHLLSVRPAAISQLARLTQLQELQVTVSVPAGPATGQGAPFGLQQLMPLTALTGLGHLACRVAREQQQGAKVEHLLDLYSEAPAGAPPDVWVQLVEHCIAEEPALQPAVISFMLRQLQQLQQQGAQLRQEHIQELAAAGQATAELRGQVTVQALQQQMQNLLSALQLQV